MKKVMILFMLTILITFSVLAYGSFCAGYKDGYKAGYCYGQYGCLAPLTPMCPMARLGENTYMDGYNRGFLAGLNKR